MTRVFIKLEGNLGNVMFLIMLGEYINSIGNPSIKVIYTSDKDRLEKYRKMIPKYDVISANDIYSEDEYGKSIYVFEEDESPMFIPLTLHCNEDNFIYGYRQNPNYWLCDRDFAKDVFKINKKAVSEVKNLYPWVDFDECVSLSVRTYNDDPNYDDVLDIIGVLTDDWYFRVIENIDKNKKIFITSDDIEYCKKLFVGDRFIFADKKSEHFKKSTLDMTICKLCGENIISNSTFSWWGAYLNVHDDNVIHGPSQFFKFTNNIGIYCGIDNLMLYESTWKDKK